jgi:hypothetical protein
LLSISNAVSTSLNSLFFLCIEPLRVLVASDSEPTDAAIRHQPKVEEDVSFAIRSL